ncbi:hypothetical protein F4780DRAFT_781933 [Xylariomycetidae sp. FL0641]|nr:hypothetical protein F4780DRAFT_781933 [Xylariomycetidae sp. FL0641]
MVITRSEKSKDIQATKAATAQEQGKSRCHPKDESQPASTPKRDDSGHGTDEDDDSLRRTTYSGPTYSYTLGVKQDKLQPVPQESTPDLETRITSLIPRISVPKYMRELGIPRGRVRVAAAGDEAGAAAGPERGWVEPEIAETVAGDDVGVEEVVAALDPEVSPYDPGEGSGSEEVLAGSGRTERLSASRKRMCVHEREELPEAGSEPGPAESAGGRFGGPSSD